MSAKSINVDAVTFAELTPDVPAEFLECDICGAEYLGNPNHKHVCPTCKREHYDLEPHETLEEQ